MKLNSIFTLLLAGLLLLSIGIAAAQEMTKDEIDWKGSVFISGVKRFEFGRKLSGDRPEPEQRRRVEPRS